MKSALALLALTTALGTSIVGALSAAPIAAPDTMAPACATAPAASCRTMIEGLPVATTEPVMAEHLILADSDGDDDDGGWFFNRKERHEKRGRDDDDDEEDDDDDGRACMPGQPGCNTPAPAGTVAPPSNGLFAPGAAPAVQVN
jgi:hypothetical protein